MAGEENNNPCCMAEKFGNWCADADIHVQHEEKTYCIFHAPKQCQGKLDNWSNDLVYQRIDRSKMNELSCDLSGTVFPVEIFFQQYDKNSSLPPISFLNVTFGGDTSFWGATFSSTADFRETTFCGDADFQYATFCGEANFIFAVFAHKANFPEVTFCDKANFVGVTFSGTANFTRASFPGGAAFQTAIFSGEAVFLSANFANQTDFKEATFSCAASYWRTTFSGRVAFRKVTFSGEADFQHATFSGTANFPYTTFSDKANFPDVTFSGKAAFGSSNFKSEATFRGTTFSDDADFQSATFAREANFEDATFFGEADFGASTFNEDVDFKNAVFEKKGGFPLAIFNKPTIFRTGDGRFPNADFSRAKFEQQVVFRKITFVNGDFDCCIANKTVIFDDCNFAGLSLGGAPLESFRFVSCQWPRSNGRSVIYDSRLASLMDKDNKVKTSELVGFFPLDSTGEEIEGHKQRPSPIYIEDQFRRLKSVAQKENDDMAASDWHYGEKELQILRLKNASSIKNIRSGGWLGSLFLYYVTLAYKWVSGYGEEPLRAFAVFMVLALLPTPLLSYVWPDLPYPFPGGVGYYLPLMKKIPDGNAWWLSFWMVLWQLLITIQAALLGFALRNKLRR